MRGHVTLCYMVVGGNLNSPLNLFISFVKALMEQGFPSDPFLAKDSLTNLLIEYEEAMLVVLYVKRHMLCDWGEMDAHESCRSTGRWPGADTTICAVVRRSKRDGRETYLARRIESLADDQWKFQTSNGLPLYGL